MKGDKNNEWQWLGKEVIPGCKAQAASEEKNSLGEYNAWL